MPSFLSNQVKLYLIIMILLGLFLLFSGHSSPAMAQDTQISPDAVAIRVMDNKNHYSPLRWYQENVKNQGSPQSLTVDGYEAVRDGRTVYVNAANIDDSVNKLYTNIYIISYNQEAENSTLDIFGQILSHWKFNSNISTDGHCSVDQTANCAYDSDCGVGQHCDSQKAKVIRDTKRLADWQDMGTAVENYKRDHGDYPRLTAGSYVASSTVSTWPSWQETLAKILNVALPADPLNSLNACQTACCAGGNCSADREKASCAYDQTTCWNQTDKKFYYNFNKDNALSVARSPVYWYKDGQFNVNLETDYALDGKIGINYSELNTGLRFVPSLKNMTIKINTGQELKYTISAIEEPEIKSIAQYDLRWSLSDNVSSFLTVLPTNVNNAVILRGVFNQAGIYPVTVMVLDKKMNIATSSVFNLIVNFICDEASGLHAVNRSCLQCTADNADSVKWENNICKPVSCVNSTSNLGYHLDSASGKCVSNTASCPLSTGAAKAEKYWNNQINDWGGSCQNSACDEASGYHLDNGSCVLCTMPNATAVKWINNICQATVCANPTVNNGYHLNISTGQCDSNTDTAGCQNITGVSPGQAVRYWNGSDFDKCQILSCDGNNGFHLSGGSCLKCQTSNVPNSTTVIWDNSQNKCVVTACANENVTGLGSGDANEDGVVNNSDINVINNFISGYGYGAGTIARGDVNNDHILDSADADLIAKFLNGTLDKTAYPLIGLVGYHVAGGQCVDNLDKSNFCINHSLYQLPAGVFTAIRHWDQTINNGAGDWSDCQTISCFTDYHYENGQCLKNTLACGIANSVANSGAKTWLGPILGWGDCANSICLTDYPDYVKNYNGTGVPACVNACGLTDNSLAINYTYYPWGNTAFGFGYAKNLQMDFYNASGGKLNQAAYNTGACAAQAPNSGYKITNDIKTFVASVPAANFISADKLFCQFTIKPNMTNTMSCASGPCYSDTSLVDANCNDLISSGLPIKFAVFDKDVFTKIDYRVPATAWNQNLSDISGFSLASFYGSNCSPSCNGKQCGSDGCGGSCGSCAIGQCNSFGECASALMYNIKVNDYYNLYFNGSKINSGDQSGNQGMMPGLMISKKINVIAIEGKDTDGAIFGIGAIFQDANAKNIVTTSNLSQWKCTADPQVNNNWQQIIFDDTIWKTPVITLPANTVNNNLPVDKIWANGAGGNSTVYCRTSFVGQ